MPLADFSSTSLTPNDALLVDDKETHVQITLLSGQNLTRGAVLGKITASGKYTLSASAAVDGSQTPDLILAEDTNATGGDKLTVAYEVATVNEAKLILGAGHTLASIREGLRVKGILLQQSQATY